MPTSYALDIVQNQRLQRGFRWKVGEEYRDLTGYSWQSQARKKEDSASPLIIDLGQYMALDPEDPTTLVLDVPSTATAQVDPKLVRDTSHWDLILWPTNAPEQALVLVEGPVVLNRSTTVVPTP